MLIIPPNEYAAAHRLYVSKAQNSNILEVLSESYTQFLEGAEKITREQAAYRYKPEKWSVKEVLQHITDAERIFCYRALCVARGEKQSLLGFDEDEYTKNSFADEKTVQQIIEEFSTVRVATISLFASFNEQQLTKLGTANNATVSVRAIGAIIVGHQLHHLDVLNTRYGLNF